LNATNIVMRVFELVVSSAQSICSARPSAIPSRLPMKRIRTPSSCSSGVSPAMRLENISINPCTSAGGRVQFSVENEYTVNSSIPSSAASRNRALTVSAPALCPSLTGLPC
jgi:hypothetical protein